MRVERLKHVAEVRVSNVDKKTSESDIPVILCNYTDVYYNDRITGSMDFMSATATRDQLAKFGLRRGDVVLTKDSETPDDIGISAWVAEDVPDLVCGYHLAVVRAHPRRAEGRYLHWVCAGAVTRQYMSAAAMGITRFGLRSEAIANLPVPLPSIQIQRAIADYLDRETARIDGLVAAKQRMLKLLADWFAVALDHALWESAAPQIPLRRIATFVDYRGATPAKQDQGIPLVTASHIRDGRIDMSVGPQYIGPQTYLEWMRRGFPSRGDVIMTTEAPLGQVAQIDDPGVALAQRLILLKVLPSRVLSDFLALALRSLHFQAQLEANATGSTALGIKADRLKALRVPVPALRQQVEVITHMRDVDQIRLKASTALSRQIALLQEHRQALITAAVTGQLDISGAA